jgi:hypothetical protein
LTFRQIAILITFAFVSSALFVVLPYVWYFHDLPIAETKPEAWANFGSYFGGIFGPVLAFLNLLAVAFIAVRVVDSQQHQVAAKKLSIDLLTEYHAESMHETRIALDELIENAALNKSRIPTLSEFERSDQTISAHAFRLYHFYEKWAVLAKHGHIDALLLADALSSRTVWWQEHFFEPIMSYEKDRHIQATLHMIKKHVLEPSSISQIR